MENSVKAIDEPKGEDAAPHDEKKDEQKPPLDPVPSAKKKGKKIKISSISKPSSRKSRKTVVVLSDSDSDSDSSESSDSSDSSDSESSSDDETRRRKKKKAAKKAKAKRAAKKAKRQESSDDSADSDSSSSEEDAKAKRKAKRGRKQRKALESEDSELDDQAVTPDQLRQLIALQASQNQQQANPVIRFNNRRKDPLINPLNNARNQLNGLNIKPANNAKASRKTSTKPQYFRGDELWDREIHAYRLRETADMSEQDDFGEYIFHVRRRFDWEGKYVDTLIDIKSKALRLVLQDVMGACKAVSLAEDTPSIDPNMLFLYLEELRSHQKELKKKCKSAKKKKERKSAAQQAAQLKLLVKYVDKDYASTKKTLYPLLEAGNITFDLLWTLFRSDEIVYTSTYSAPDEPRAFKVDYATRESSLMKGTWYAIDGKYLDFDGKQFGLGNVGTEIESFKGTRRITALPCYPLKYHKEVEKITEQLIERGKKFVGLAGMKYMAHVGLGFTKRKRQVLKVSTNTRMMVDPHTFRRINPNYPISTIKPQDDYLDDPDGDSEGEYSCCEEDEVDERGLENTDTTRTRLKLFMDKKNKFHFVEVEVDEDGNEVATEAMEKLQEEGGELKREFTEEELLIASPVVLGFAFSEKLWLEFTVSGIQEIEWNEGAFDSLVLPDSQKSLVKALVQSHTTESEERKTIDDVIKGKGKGLVAVLHGSPGVGKTLTAEGIAELLKCPLYCVSAGELGTHPRELEAELTKILDVAHAWGAVLLLDEADVFMEARTAQDIHRNALVSIFLRVLEYFQGILFLTTNRVSTFDDAFQSRIHIALRVGRTLIHLMFPLLTVPQYQELDFKARRTIFKMFIDKVAQTATGDKPIEPAAGSSTDAPVSPTAPSSSNTPSVADSSTFTNVTKADAETDDTPNSEAASDTPSGSTASPASGTGAPKAGKPWRPAIATFTENDLDRLARREHFNGRQIKNAVRSAQALAVNEGVPMGMPHVLKVLDVAEAFERDLKGGTGYLEAMRSYT